MLQIRTTYQQAEGYKQGYKLNFEIQVNLSKSTLQIRATNQEGDYVDYVNISYPSTEKDLRHTLNNLMDTYISKLDDAKQRS